MKPVRLEAPSAVRWIVRTLEAGGFETWAVGGAVRNALLGLPPGDWDLTTRALPRDVRRAFRRTVPIGIEHGTVGVLARDGTLYEVTTFRRDVRTDGRHAVVAFADRLEDDLARRDFTVNAVAWHPLEERICDPWDGAGDLKRKVLRTVGEPDRRFREDFLRVLRAFRFAGRFDLEVDRATWAAARALVGETRRLSAERIRDELVKVLDDDPDPRRTLLLYEESGALAVLYPELAALGERPAEGSGEAEVDRWSLTLARVSALPRGRPWLRLAALLRDVPATDRAAVLARLRLSQRRADEVARAAGAPPLPVEGSGEAAVRRWLSAYGPGNVAAAARLELAEARARCASGLPASPREVVAAWTQAKRVRALGPPLEIADLALDGRDLVRLGLRPGPRFGRILEELLEWVLEDPARNRRDRLEERVDDIAGDEHADA